MRIKEPFAQERLSEENIYGLKNNLGTNIGKLVNQIIKSSNEK